MQVLILLENVCNGEQRDALLPGCLRLPPGSIIIMTATSGAVLRHEHYADVQKHRAELLSTLEAIQLVLLWAALPENNENSDLVKPVAEACHGMALMLKVAGCSLLKDRSNFWCKVWKSLSRMTLA